MNIIFTCTTNKSVPGRIFESTKPKMINAYEINFQIVEKKSSNKIHTRIKNIKATERTKKNKKLTATLLNEITAIVSKIESQYLIETIDRNDQIKKIEKESDDLNEIYNKSDKILNADINININI